MTPLHHIKNRCRIDPDTGCWVWAGAASKDRAGALQARVYSVDYSADPTGNTKTVQTGGRAAWHAHTGAAIAPGLRVYHCAKCTHPLCVNPAHLLCGPTAQWGQQVATLGAWRDAPARVIANRVSGQRRAALTPEQVRHVLASADTGAALARALGTTPKTISRARLQRQAYARTAAGNPWSGLGGLAA